MIPPSLWYCLIPHVGHYFSWRGLRVGLWVANKYCIRLDYLPLVQSNGIYSVIKRAEINYGLLISYTRPAAKINSYYLHMAIAFFWQVMVKHIIRKYVRQLKICCLYVLQAKILHSTTVSGCVAPSNSEIHGLPLDRNAILTMTSQGRTSLLE